MQPQRTIRAALSLGLTRFLLPVGITLSLVLGVTAGAVIGLGLTAKQAGATTVDDEQTFVRLINDLRAAKGVPPLTVDAELTNEARAWTTEMAATDKLAHSPSMAKGISAQWSVLGENVGVHGVHDLDDLFQAFVNSSAHYKNLVDARFNHVGVGVVHSENGKLWTTHRFMAAPLSTPDAAPTPTAPSTTAPPVTQAPATKPPTTKSPATNPAANPVAAPPSTKAPNTPPSTKVPTVDKTKPTVPVAANPAPADQPVSGPATNSPAPITGNPTDAGGATSSDTAVGGADAGSSSATGSESDSDSLEAERIEMAERVKPDPETIEDVLIELVLAGI